MSKLWYGRGNYKMTDKVLIDFEKKTNEGEDFMEVFKELVNSFNSISNSLADIAQEMKR